MRKVLTDIVVHKTKPPADVWDLKLPGFGLRVSKGARSFCVMYRIGDDPRQHRMTIGSAALMGLEEARERAREALKAAKDGLDPKVKVAPPERPTVGAAFERYMTQRVKPNFGARTARELRAMFERDVLPRLGTRPIEEVRKGDVVATVDAVVERGAPISANRVHGAMRAFFNWAVAKDLLEASPATGTKKPIEEVARDRALSEDEIRWFWEATGAIGATFGTPFRLMLVTAQRRDEVREMRWREVDLNKRTWTIPPERAKNGKRHEVALSDLAMSLLEGLEQRKAPDDLVFASERPRPGNRGRSAVSGLSKAKRRLDAAMAEIAGHEVEAFTLHDLRRTAVTQMAAIGVPAEVADKALNHKSGVIAGVKAIYQRHEYKAEQRDALTRWGRHLAALVGEGEAGRVVDLPKKRARA